VNPKRYLHRTPAAWSNAAPKCAVVGGSLSAACACLVVGLLGQYRLNVPLFSRLPKAWRRPTRVAVPSNPIAASVLKRAALGPYSAPVVANTATRPQKARVEGLAFKSINKIGHRAARIRTTRGEVRVDPMYQSTLTTLFFNCDVAVNKQACTKCEMISCGAPNQFKEPSINCTNLTERGRGKIQRWYLYATRGATACSGRSAGGPVSLDESALNGILAPLAYSHLLCQRGMVVVGNPTPTIPTGPTAADPPMSAPTIVASPNDNDCGLFNLGFFCFRGCGLIRRILGLC
jgi:hypothetical protein